MLFLGLSVPGEVPRCSASVLVLLAGFLNSVRQTPKRKSMLVLGYLQ